jgi:hypothetical protein
VFSESETNSVASETDDPSDPSDSVSLVFSEIKHPDIQKPAIIREDAEVAKREKMSKFRKKLQSKKEILISDLENHLESSIGQQNRCIDSEIPLDLHLKSAFRKAANSNKKKKRANMGILNKQKTIGVKDISHLFTKLPKLNKKKRSTNMSNIRRRKFASIDNPMEFWSKFSH